jgi:hypothetical protein
MKIYEFSTAPLDAFEEGGVLYGFDPDAIDSPDYDSARGLALYEALGVSPDDDEYVLGELHDGRWALVGLTVEGHSFAVE